MDDPVQRLADDVRNGTAEACALVAEIFRIPEVESEFQHGYNTAITHIASKMRELKKGKV